MTAPESDGYVYLITYTERTTMEFGVIQLNTMSLELSNTTESSVRARISALQAQGNVQDMALQRRLPTPAYEAMTL